MVSGSTFPGGEGRPPPDDAAIPARLSEAIALHQRGAARRGGCAVRGRARGGAGALRGDAPAGRRPPPAGPGPGKRRPHPRGAAHPARRRGRARQPRARPAAARARRRGAGEPRPGARAEARLRAGAQQPRQRAARPRPPRRSAGELRPRTGAAARLRQRAEESGRHAARSQSSGRSAGELRPCAGAEARRRRHGQRPRHRAGRARPPCRGSWPRSTARSRGNPDYAEALANRANALLDLKRYEEAAGCFATLVERAPDYPFARGQLLHARMLCCDWTGFDELAVAVRDDVRAGRQSAEPFGWQGVSDSPADLQALRRDLRRRALSRRRSAAVARRAVRATSGFVSATCPANSAQQATSILMAERVRAARPRPLRAHRLRQRLGRRQRDARAPRGRVRRDRRHRPASATLDAADADPPRARSTSWSTSTATSAAARQGVLARRPCAGAGELPRLSRARWAPTTSTT